MLQFMIENLGAFQGDGNTRADVPRADVLFKFGLMHQTGGLFTRAAEDQAAAGGMHGIGQLFESLQAGSVDGRHVAETQHEDGRQLRKSLDHLVNLIGSAKKKRSVDAEDGHVRRNFLVLQDVHLSFAQDIRR